MFRSLRSKLVLSHFVVILIAFLLTALIASVPIRRVQETRLRNSLAQSSEGVARQIDLTRTLGPNVDLIRDTTQIDFAQRLIDAEQRRSGNRILILDEDAQVLLDSSPNRSLEGQTISSFASPIDTLERRIGVSPPPTRAPARVALVLDTVSVGAGDLGNRPAVVAATAATSVPQRNNLYVAAIAPGAAAPIIDDFVRPLTLAAGLGLMASIVLGAVLARSVTKPLQRLTTTVRTITGGDLDKRVDMKSGGEIGTLVHAFNGMMDRLDTTYRSQRELLANIAHELRTPLTSIQGYSQALRDGVIQEEDARQDALDALSDEARRMTELVEQILQLSRLESGQFPIRFSDTAIRDVFTRVERQFAPIATERGIELIVDRHVELTWLVDEELIVQALGNLASNAIRHSRSGDRIEMRASRVSTPSSPPDLRLTVRDTGEGMDDEQLERVFERFYRTGERSAQIDARNYGLGLAIVQEIIDRHRGEISVESTPGQGTTFTIDLPMHPDENQQDGS